MSYERDDSFHAGASFTADENDIPLLERSSDGSSTHNTHRRPQAVRRKPLATSSFASTLLHSTADTGRYNRANTVVYSPLDNDGALSSVAAADAGGMGKCSHRQDVAENSIDNTLDHVGWRPNTLQWPYLMILLVISLVLLATVVFLQIHSRLNIGLGEDGGQSILFFGWRFAPTMIAVFYALLFTMLLDDAKRTEPYVRLSCPGGGSADSTILHEPGAWWNALADGFSRSKNNGSRSWTLIFASTGLILALIVSPLSSTFLVPLDVVVTRDVSFNRLRAYQSAPVDFGDQVVPRFHTISNLLQNITTSVWITDEFAVLPFWPPSLSVTPFGASLGGSPEIWRAETTVLKSELDCKRMYLTTRESVNVTFFQHWNTTPPRTTNITQRWGSVTLSTDDGCVHKLALYNSTYVIKYGGSSWARTGDFAFGVDQGISTGTSLLADTAGQYVQMNHTWQCAGDEVLIMSTPWFDEENRQFNSSLQVGGQICATNYYAANVTVSLNTTESNSVITFDSNEFDHKRLPIDDSLVDTNQFEDIWLSTNWSYHLYPPIGGPGGLNGEGGTFRPSTGGPSSLIAAIYNFSMTDAIQSKDIVFQAARAKQRYFGEALISSLSQQPDPATVVARGQIVSFQSRIVVAQAIAFALEALLIAEVMLISALYWITRQHKRTMGVKLDPAKAIVIATLISESTSIRHDFKNLYGLPLSDIKAKYSNTKFYTSAQQLHIRQVEETEGSADETGDRTLDRQAVGDWRPFVLRRRAVTGLFLCLLIVLVAIAVLYAFALGPGLYQKAFVYEVQVDVASHLSTFAPFSVIPTVLAVTIGLWWGSIETEFRILQPYLAMARRPTSLRYGMNESYQSSYLLWAAVKAAITSNWLLSLICTGAFLSQLLTIAMSALWQPQNGFRHSSMSIQRNLELRIVPSVFEAYAQRRTDQQSQLTATVLSNLYGQLQTNWLYSAIIQMTLDGAQPPWSLDGWSFVPLDLSALDSTFTLQKESTSSATGQSRQILATVTTPAVRARLECSPFESLSNISNWATARDLTNSTVWNVTANPTYPTSGYTLGCDTLGVNYMLIEPNYSSPIPCGYKTYTSFLSHLSQVQCCENTTTGTNGDAVFGYWSPNIDNNLVTPPNNFTVKWIYGNPVAGFRRARDVLEYNKIWPQRTVMVWPKPPQMAALNCMPIIEKANASVTVDQQSGRVQAYTILDKPQNDTSAFADYFVQYSDLFPANLSGPDAAQAGYYTNITTSYGALFRISLLYAADMTNLANVVATAQGKDDESVRDATFNFRKPGLNMDYMSYAMYSQVNQSMTALLDQNLLHHYANKTFSTFFQHFVSSNMSIQNGGWAYQKIGAKLHPDTGRRPTSASRTDPNSTVSYTNPTAEVTVSTRVKMLHISPLAAWLCMSILSCLIITTTIILFVEKQYLAKMFRGVKTIADIAVLMAGSSALLKYILRSRYTDQQDLDAKTKLGWFKDTEGHERWGIELVGSKYGVQWLDGPEDVSGQAIDMQEGRRYEPVKANSLVIDTDRVIGDDFAVERPSQPTQAG